MEIGMDNKAEEALRSWDWPGNVRELSNVLERVSSSLQRETIYLCDLPFYLLGNKKRSAEKDQTSLKSVQGRSEIEAIRYALESTKYNKVRAAATLGIHRSLLYKKMKKYNLALNQADIT